MEAYCFAIRKFCVPLSLLAVQITVSQLHIQESLVIIVLLLVSHEIPRVFRVNKASNFEEVYLEVPIKDSSYALVTC